MIWMSDEYFDKRDGGYMDDLRKNGSGYTDPTAYKAIKNILKEDNAMEEVKRGEIWSVEGKNYTRDFLVIQQKNGYCIGIMLCDVIPKNADPDDVYEVMSRTLMYADAGKLTYVTDNTPKQYVKTISDDRIEAIIEKVSNALQLSHREMPTERAPIQYNLVTDSTELVAVKTERDIFKGLYTNLLERVMKGA